MITILTLASATASGVTPRCCSIIRAVLEYAGHKSAPNAFMALTQNRERTAIMVEHSIAHKQVFKSIDPELAKDRFSYDPETGNLIWKNCKSASTSARLRGKVAGHIHTCTVGKKYIQVRVNDVLHYAHRIIWEISQNYHPNHGLERPL